MRMTTWKPARLYPYSPAPEFLREDCLKLAKQLTDAKWERDQARDRRDLLYNYLATEQMLTRSEAKPFETELIMMNLKLSELEARVQKLIREHSVMAQNVWEASQMRPLG
jgi:hypothetical protein